MSISCLIVGWRPGRTSSVIFLYTAVAVSVEKCEASRALPRQKHCFHICSALGTHSQYCFKIIFLTGTWGDLSPRHAPVYTFFPSSFLSFLSWFLPAKFAFFFPQQTCCSAADLTGHWPGMHLSVVVDIFSNHKWMIIHHQCEYFVFDACFTCLLLIFGPSITAWSKYSCHCMNFFCSLPRWKGPLIGLWWKWYISDAVFSPEPPSLS